MPPKNKQNHVNNAEDSNLALVKTLTEIVNKLIYSYEKNEKINLTKVAFNSLKRSFYKHIFVYSLNMKSPPNTRFPKCQNSLTS